MPFPLWCSWVLYHVAAGVRPSELCSGGLGFAHDAIRRNVESRHHPAARDGQLSAGNWIGVNSVGPFPVLAPGQSVTVTFAFVAALKPEAFQGAGAPRAADTPESRALLRNNVFWAQETYAGEDANYNGRLDAGEDLNGNGVLDRYLIPEPPAAP